MAASSRWAWVLPLVCVAFASCRTKEEAGLDCDESPGELFERRIAPLMEADHPNTCGQCHAGGVELAAFLRPDPCESMACLKNEGLVDLKNPERSVLLGWVERARPDNKLITDKVVDEEYEAILSWIEHESACNRCADVECGDPEAPKCNYFDGIEQLELEEDSGGCEPGDLENLFRDTVYSFRGRCAPCHFQEEDEEVSPAARWLTETGNCKVASAASLRAIEAFDYINLEDPENSLLITKPLAEEDGGVPHHGEAKITKEFGTAYERFINFLTRYSECKKQE